MANVSKIEWCDSTFNPWIGCTKVSTAAHGGGGCDHCYAHDATPVRVLRGSGHETFGPGARRKRTSLSNWKQPLRWNRTPFCECSECNWRGEPGDAVQANGLRCPSCGARGSLEEARRRVFCASLADVFDNEVDSAWRADLFALIAATANLEWLVLTKRIGNSKRMIGDALDDLAERSRQGLMPFPAPWPWKQVQLGITIVNRAEMLRDGPKLVEHKGLTTYWSYEPALGDLGPIPEHLMPGWVIAGGESGLHARPAHPEWFRLLRDQCAAAGVPFLFKQWGEWHTAAFIASSGQAVFRKFPDFETWVNKASTWVNGGICLDRNGRELKTGGDMMRARDSGEFPVTIMHRVGKQNSGRILDGIEHGAFPKGHSA